MRSTATIVETFLIALTLLPAANSQDRAAYDECEGPYKGISLTQQAHQEILDDSRLQGACLNLCGANLNKLNLGAAVLTGPT